ncbi:MAG: glycosyltransferase family 2 protein [Gammaproteobacteria bacterium]
MYKGLHITAVIPALNEAEAIYYVVSDLRSVRDDKGLVIIDDVIVADNGSTDDTAILAKQGGARVVHEARKGYGAACLAGISAASTTDVILFVDGDHSMVSHQAIGLLNAIYGGADLVIGSRTLGNIETGAMTWPQRVGNQLVTRLISLIWRTKVTDLGPFRAIRLSELNRLNMQDKAYGWTVEMQVKALQQGIKTQEIPVDCLVRVGRSKANGTARGVIGAASGMLGTVLRLWSRGRCHCP